MLLAGGVGLAAGLAIRYGLIEPPQLGWVCQVAAPPWWCPARSAVILILQWGALGWAGLAAGIVALFGRGRTWSACAEGLGASGLILYAAGPASIALLLALMRSLRLGATTPGGSRRSAA
jgi:hypothetical protein